MLSRLSASNLEDWEKTYFETDEQKAQFDETFYAHKKIVKLLDEARSYERQRKLLLANSTYLKIAKIRKSALEDLLAESKRTAESEKVALRNLGLAPEDESKICDYSLALYALCDMVTAYCIDIDDILKRYNKNLSFEQFNKLRKMLTESRSMLSTLANTTTILDFTAWGEIVDKYKSMLDEKVKKIRKQTAQAEARVKHDKSQN